MSPSRRLPGHQLLWNVVLPALGLALIVGAPVLPAFAAAAAAAASIVVAAALGGAPRPAPATLHPAPHRALRGR
jgi:hypothetical protein